MIAKKFKSLRSPGEKATIRLQVESVRELELLTAIFTNTYKIQDLANQSPKVKEAFSHDEVKELADQIYIALVSNTEN